MAIRVPVGLGFAAISCALYYRAVIFFSAPWALLAGISAVFLLISIPWLVSAVLASNVWWLYFGPLIGLFIVPLGFVFLSVILAGAHHAGDFKDHAVARTGTVVAAPNEQWDPVGHVWYGPVTIALRQPVAGHQSVVLRLAHQVDYATGDRVSVLIDPRHPGDVELAGKQGLAMNAAILAGTVSTAGVLIAIAVALTCSVALADAACSRNPDFIGATWASWTRWRREPQDLVPWTGAVRMAAWLPVLAIDALGAYAILEWSQWWLLLLPGTLLAILGPVMAARRSFPLFRHAALPLASVAVAAAVPVLLITGALPAAVAVPLTAAAWLGFFLSSRVCPIARGQQEDDGGEDHVRAADGLLPSGPVGLAVPAGREPPLRRRHEDREPRGGSGQDAAAPFTQAADRQD